jgi:hypothetical protein
MNARILCMFLIVTAVLSTAASAAAPAMKDGLWEITTTTKVPGMPFTPPPVTITNCYTKDDVKNQQVVPKQEGNCTIRDLKTSGAKTSWKIVCTGEQSGKGEGEITWKGDSAYEGKQKFTTQGMSITSSYKARRIGACK